MNKTRRRRCRRATQEARARDKALLFGEAMFPSREALPTLTAIPLPSVFEPVKTPISKVDRKSEQRRQAKIARKAEIDLRDRARRNEIAKSPTEAEWAEITNNAKTKRKSIKVLAVKKGWVLLNERKPKVRDSWLVYARASASAREGSTSGARIR